MNTLRVSRLAIALATFVALGACSDNKEVVTAAAARTAATIAIDTTTNNQSGTVNTSLAKPAAVKLLTSDNLPAYGAEVTWTIVSGGGFLTSGGYTNTGSTTSIADSSGTAHVAWAVGSTAGTNTLKAAIAGGPSVTFTAVAK